MKIKKMKRHTRDFLCSLLFIADPDSPEDEARTFHGAGPDEFSPAFIAAAESFVDGFECYLAAIGFEMDRLESLESSFGGNVLLSLSGSGCGFFDEYSLGDRDLGRDLQWHLEKYSGDRWRFEFLPPQLGRNDSGEIDLSFLPAFLEEKRAAIFNLKPSGHVAA